MTPVLITYDPSADAAYISLRGELLAGESVKMYACDPEKVGGMINLDFDRAGRLIGIEVLGASSKLPQALLASIGRDQSTSQATDAMEREEQIARHDDLGG